MLNYRRRGGAEANASLIRQTPYHIRKVMGLVRQPPNVFHACLALCREVPQRLFQLDNRKVLTSKRWDETFVKAGGNSCPLWTDSDASVQLIAFKVAVTTSLSFFNPMALRVYKRNGLPTNLVLLLPSQAHTWL